MGRFNEHCLGDFFKWEGKDLGVFGGGVVPLIFK